MLQQTSGVLTVHALLEMEKLRTIFREGWVNRGIKKVDLENDVEHSYRVSSLTLALPLRRSVNRLKSSATALIHDFDEAVLGDEARREKLVLFDEDPRLLDIASAIEDPDFDKRRERARKLLAFEMVVDKWPTQSKQEALSLYHAYTYASTLEALLVHQAHVLADLIRGQMYMAGECPSGTKYRKLDLDTFWEDAETALDWEGPVDLKPILEELREQEVRLKAAA